jgi:threonine aldolase
VYRATELAELSDVAHANGMRMHVDGARFANAVVATGASPAELSWQAGVDMLSFGATKNGCMAAEALLVFDAGLVETIEFRRKRAGQLWSKGRYLGAQFNGYLANDYWLDLARHANTMAERLATGLGRFSGLSLAYPRQVNEVFVHLPAKVADDLLKAGAVFYPWVCPGLGPRAQVYRLITSWNTTQEEVDKFLALLDRILA